MVAKYSIVSEWDPKLAHEGHGVGMWKAILKGRREFWRFIRFRVGLGKDFRFWADPWCGNNPCKV